MAPYRQSWATVEEKLLIDIAIWKSSVLELPRPAEEIALVEGAVTMPTGKGVATMRIGKLDWELTPPSNYTGYCEITKEDWLLVSGFEFKVAVRSPYGTCALQVCPRSEEVEFFGSQALLPLSMQNLGLCEGSLGVNVSIDNLDADDKLSNSLLARFFDTREAATLTSQKRRAEIIGEKFSTPFLRCVIDLQTAKRISDVLEIIVGLSAAYDFTQQALQQEQEETFDLTTYFYNEQVWEKDCSRNNGSFWVREQVNCAAMKCQTAAAATSEAAKVFARILVDSSIKPSEEVKLNSKVVDNLSDSEMDECSDEVNPNSTASPPFDNDGLIHGSSSRFEELMLRATQQHFDSEYLGSGAAHLDGPSLDLLDPLDCDQVENGDLGESSNPTGTFLRTNSFGSSWQSDVGNDTCSESSWEVLRSVKNESVEDEADGLGAEFSDAESLNMMLRDLDPFGKRDCSPLIDEFLTLNMNSATCSADDSDEENSNYVQVERESKVLQRLASWSSSNSGSWTDHDILSSASSMRKMRTARLETLAEEPACDPGIARLYRSFVFRAATEGNVLQWCSCKFNRLRCSIELKFQVGSFMEDDIATLSTGISRESLLHVEIFLDVTNVRESLLKGDVRVSAHQGVPFGSERFSWKNAGDKSAVLPPVVGLSCYIPHLVRQYLKQEVHVKRSTSGYQFPGGELLTGLMQYVVAQLVFIKHTCCVCNHEKWSDVLTSIVPTPCAKNLCQALYNAWLVVAPPVVLELSSVVNWLKASADEDPLHEAFMNHYMTHQDATCKGTNEEKVQRVANWLANTKVTDSWLKISIPKPKIDEKFESGTSESQATKRRKTFKPNDFKWNSWQPVSSPPPAPKESTSPLAPKQSNVLRPSPLFLFSSKQKGENISTSTGPSKRIPTQAQGESSSQGDQGWQKILEDLEPLSLKEISDASAGPPKGSPAQTQAGKLSFRDFSKVEKRTPSHAPGTSRFQEKIKESLTNFESASHSPQARGKSTSQEKRMLSQTQGESSSQDSASSSWEDLIDEA